MEYTDYAAYISRFYPDFKVQKISINAGFSCPNRDGTIGRGGCIYCDNTTFTPGYCFSNDSVIKQIEAGKDFFGKKYPDMKYIAYFQSYTNTCGDIDSLRRLYMDAFSVKDVVGLAIGTRPDCLPQPVVDMLSQINRKVPVFVELGVESSFDETLKIINRGHTWAATVDSINRLAEAGLHIGVHLIAGLPDETVEMMLETVDRCCLLPIETIKLHQLQVIRDTELHRRYMAGTVKLHKFTAESYRDFCVEVIRQVPKHIAIERFLASSPPDKVISPKWNIKNYQFVNLIKQAIK